MAEAKKPNILVIWGDDIGWSKRSVLRCRIRHRDVRQVAPRQGRR